MTFSQAVLRALLAFVGFVVIQIITGMLVPMKPVALPHIFQWMLLSNAVVVTSLSIVAVRTKWRGWKMGAAVASIPLSVRKRFLRHAAFALDGRNGRVASDNPRAGVCTSVRRVHANARSAATERCAGSRGCVHAFERRGAFADAESFLSRLRSLGALLRSDERELRVRCDRRRALGPADTGRFTTSTSSGLRPIGAQAANLT
jgi:hypothetical protein